jgi:hypothetical protein
MANPCVKTGARVLVVEYGGVAPADLFLVGSAIVARFGCDNRITLDYSADAVAYATHRMTLGQTGWYREDLGVAVVPIAQLEGELVRSHSGCPVPASQVAAELTMPTATCPDCGGGGTVTLEAPSRDPQLEQDVTCPRCYGRCEVPATQAMIDGFEAALGQGGAR